MLIKFEFSECLDSVNSIELYSSFLIKMLKFFIFVLAITLFETCNDSGVQCLNFTLFKADCSCDLEKVAEKLFIADEAKKLKDVDDIRDEIRKAKGGLSVIQTAKALVPTSKNLIAWLFSGIRKVAQVVSDLGNIWTRDYGKLKLKKAIKKNEEEALFEKGLSGQDICKKAFKHKFFKDYKRWDLVIDHPKTKEMKKLWIRVQTDYYEHEDGDEKDKEKEKGKEEEKEREKFWRPSKRCMAKKMDLDHEDDPNEPFKVYISAAKDFGRTKYGVMLYRVFVFTKTDRSKRDFWNKWVFFWQRVVHVEAYIW